MFGYRSEDCVVLLHKGHTRQPTDGHVTDVKGPGNRGQGLALGQPRQRLILLMLGELRLPTKPNSASLGSDPPFVGSAQDQMAFELGQSTKYSQHQPPMWRRSIRPRIAQRFEARPSFADCRQRVEQVPG